MSVRLLSRSLQKAAAKQCSSQKCSFHRLSDAHVQLQNTVRKYAQENLKPIAAELDKQQKFPEKQVKELGELGLLAISVSQKWGGSGQDMLGLSIAVEEVARACGGTGAIVSIHNCLYVNLVDYFGNDVQKERFLRPFTKGELGCFALSEPDAGSDVSSMGTVAKKDGDNFILNGTKSWVTNGPKGKAAVVFATVDKSLKHKGITGFLVPLPSEGVTLGKTDDKLGIRASPSCNLILENVKVPKENVIGEIGEGFKIAMMQLDRARVGIASQAVGIGQAALDLAVDYAGKRIAFGKTINQMQAVKMRIADMALQLEAARLLVRRAAILCDEPERTTKESSMAKLAASEAATFISHNCIQILGGMGYVTDMPAERHYRDARITEIYGGSTDIQKFLIADMVIKTYE